jgi:ribosomal protein S18 acetylase RimI-like enzyme
LDTLFVDASSSKEDLELLRQYFSVRYNAFKVPGPYGTNLPEAYKDGPDQFDIDPDHLEDQKDTAYLLGIEKGKVVAGRRFVFGRSGDDKTLPMDVKYAGTDNGSSSKNLIRLLPPEFHPEKMTYLEISGLAVAPEYQARSLGFELSQAGLELIAKGKIQADVMIGVPNPNSFTHLLKAVRAAGLYEIVLEDHAFTEPTGVTMVPMMFSPHPELGRAFEQMRQGGVGVPTDDFVRNVVIERNLNTPTKEIA